MRLYNFRRVFAPFGLKGGKDGMKGVNLYRRYSDNALINLGSKNNLWMEPLDSVIICTPGGGGWGDPNEK